ncbi:hypothetical protein LIS66_19925 [Pseudomonas sp. HN2]|uniref:hypothetical protein n=1 Tax=Pseudomonas sp. HN2 TaxID=2884805 RepID=UPI001D138DA3|nr:hypothetical protein [Pseudomonas sp. HN2]UEB94630.1 hypothetical protein LIS66_19925 [Pseudomonas sp. HN2]
MDGKINFLYQAISDCQATIRAIDAKIGFLMVIIFIPLAGIKEIILLYKQLNPICLYIAPSMWAIASTWAATVLILFRALWSVKNPGKSVIGGEGLGSFFNSANYKLSLIDCVFNFPIKSNSSLAEAISKLPNNSERVIQELMYEKMKLEYIRDIKMRRCSVSAALILTWVGFGIAIYTFSLLR